jgi:hypothetical protein
MVELVFLQSISYMAGAVGVCVAAVYYVMNIYDKASNKEFNASWNRFIIAQFNTWDQFRKLYSSDKDFYEAWWVTSMFFEGVGLLVKEGLMPIRIVECLMGGMARSYCEKLQPIITNAREALGFTRFCDNSLFLYDELMKYFREHPELDTRIDKMIMDMPQ